MKTYIYFDFSVDFNLILKLFDYFKRFFFLLIFIFRQVINKHKKIYIFFNSDLKIKILKHKRRIKLIFKLCTIQILGT